MLTMMWMQIESGKVMRTIMVVVAMVMIMMRIVMPMIAGIGDGDGAGDGDEDVCVEGGTDDDDRHCDGCGGCDGGAVGDCCCSRQRRKLERPLMSVQNAAANVIMRIITERNGRPLTSSVNNSR